MTFRRRRRVQKQTMMQSETVMMSQAIIDMVDKLFETMEGYFKLVRERKQQKLSDSYLLTMNQILIQSMNVFGVTCHNYRRDKRLMNLAKARFDEKWEQWDVANQQAAQNYKTYIELALDGREMDLYPLLHRSEAEEKKKINAKSVNNAFSELIGGGCRRQKRLKEVFSDIAGFGKKQDDMIRKHKQSTQNKKKTLLASQQPPAAKDMIYVPGVDKTKLKFESNNDIDIDMDLNGNGPALNSPGLNGPDLASCEECASHCGHIVEDGQYYTNTSTSTSTSTSTNANTNTNTNGNSNWSIRMIGK